MIRGHILVVVALLLGGNPAVALELASPVACKLGTDCFIQQYVDHDPSAGSRDARCGSRTYDGHKGTDFALPDVLTMQRGVKVLAVADGVVTGIRDGMDDGAFLAGEQVKGRECGNGLAIRHSDGWTTQYCHLKSGSVSIRSGESVKTGAVLGEIGMSGQSEFPHLHLQLRQGNAFIDPFDGTAMNETCDVDRDTLWAAKSGVAYSPGGLLSAGIVSAAPDYDEIKNTSPHEEAFGQNAPAMVLWGHAFGVDAGDVLHLNLRDPNGNPVSEQKQVLKKQQARSMRFVGRKKRGDGWPAGTYLGVVRLLRGGDVISERTVRTVVR